MTSSVSRTEYVNIVKKCNLKVVDIIYICNLETTLVRLHSNHSLFRTYSNQILFLSFINFLIFFFLVLTTWLCLFMKNEN